jgi:large subunit ribosomal protein L24
MMKIRKGDQVKILAGKDLGKTGKVLRVINEKNRVVVENINIHRKNVRPRREGEKGQIVETPASIHISNIALICTKCGKSTKVGFRFEEAKKVRYCKKCKKVI